MLKTRWLLAVPLLLAAPLASARAASVNDNAGMFDPRAATEATTKLGQIESQYGLPVTIETIESLRGRNINDVLKERARAERAEGLYVLISKNDHKIQADASGQFQRAFPADRCKRVWEPMSARFRDKDFDGGLLAGVSAIRNEAAAAQAEFGSLRQTAPARRAVPGVAPVRRRGGQGTFGIGTLFAIGLLVIAVLIGIRLLGALFGAGRGYAGPGRMGGPGYGPGYGGGGGFWSGLLGGLGGAVAGNWLYDQFSGRHHHGDYADTTSYGGTDVDTSAPDNNDWSGSGGGWDDAGGGGGGGDWGGGGGGDWGGGGGGDWGGGGGDGGGW